MSDDINKYKLTFPRTQIRLYNETQLTFTIGQIKSRTPSVIYWKWNGYNLNNELISEYTSPRMIVLTHYDKLTHTFTIPYTSTNYTSNDIDNYTIELYLLGVSSENPLYMNHLQLNTGDEKDYHQPNDVTQNVSVGFKNNSYINLYDETETFLQIIRPEHKDITTTELLPSNVTILAPHLPDETEFDNPVALFYEYMYQYEQEIGVEK